MNPAAQPAEESVPVDALSFTRAETDNYFDNLLALSGGLGRWHHARQPVSVDEQTLIRTNRDTLYSSMIVDITAGAELTMPEADGRNRTAMIVNQDHYINRVFDRPGTYQLSIAALSPYVLVAVRTLVDPTDPRDLEAVTALQDRLALSAPSATPFNHPAWDKKTLTATRNTLLELARASVSTAMTFGSRQQIDPIAHLLSTASGWGGLPAGCRPSRRRTSASSRNCRPGTTHSLWAKSQSGRSGRSASTTRRVISRRTTWTGIR